MPQIQEDPLYDSDATSADKSRDDTENAAGSDTALGRRAGFLESFRYRSFRFQWSSDGVAQWGFEMEALILGWFVLVETDSAFLVGLVGALRFLGTLGGPVYGLIVDRFDRRMLLISSRGLLAILALVTASLALSGSLVAWHAFVIATLLGSLRMFDNVVRQSLIADVVPRRNLLNAMGLSRSMQDASKITGALAGGALLAQLGLGTAYTVILGLYVTSSLLAFGVALGHKSRVRITESPLRSLAQGARYIRDREAIVGIMFLAFLVNLTTFPITQGLMPVVARDIYETGEQGLATLLSAAALGAMLGSLLLAAMARANRPGRVMLIGITGWHVALIVFSQIDIYPLALVVLVVLGLFSSLAMVSMSVFLLSTADPEFRGRVMGIRSLAVSGLWIGLLGGGFLADRYDVETAFIVFGLVGLGLTALSALKWRVLWTASVTSGGPES